MGSFCVGWSGGGWWYDPRTGIATPLTQVLAGTRIELTSPPAGPDWVLVLEDAHAGYAPPGLEALP